MDEHVFLIRRMGRVQQRMTETVQALTARIERLEGEVIRWRVHAIVARTAALWGLSGQAQVEIRWSPSHRRQTLGKVLEAGGWTVAEVICQTGCASHAHHWLEADGHCRRDGLPCERLERNGTSHIPVT